MRDFKNSNMFQYENSLPGGSGGGFHGPGYGGGGSGLGFQGNQTRHVNQGHQGNQGGYNHQGNQQQQSGYQSNPKQLIKTTLIALIALALETGIRTATTITRTMRAGT